jgi:hypothetical protein
MKKIITSIIMSIVLFQLPSFAKVNPKLQEYFQREIQKITKAVTDSETKGTSSIAGGNDNEMWFLNRFRLYFRASMGFEADGLAQLLVQPEVELLFLRYPAPGWAGYKP